MCLFGGKKVKISLKSFKKYSDIGSKEVKDKYKPENHFVKSQRLEQMAEFRPPSWKIPCTTVRRLQKLLLGVCETAKKRLP